ncbi:MAG: ribonuclease H-like domain-containing protein [Candidatus Aureabacteria bacterium]|nr:ribonuclease H-like domain-containing protein [Candidatus Auribacterota bacterium]
MSIYLDIETNRSGEITVVGFFSVSGGLVQMVKPDITGDKLIAALPETASRIVTYNGNCFDLNVIRKTLGVNLRGIYESCDLRWICQKGGLTGGMKRVESVLNISRVTTGIDGREALYLWDRFAFGGDIKALELLLEYNKEDVLNLIEIEKKLIERNIYIPASGG